MISSALIGRLGNSMFQVAHSIGYARKYGYQWAAQEQPHNNESAIHRVFPDLPKTNERGLRINEHPNADCIVHGTHYDLCHFDYHAIPDSGANVYFSGFWQSYKYFEHCKEEVKEVFKLPHVEGYEDYVSCHVRRGDYVQHAGSFPPITMDYIMKADYYINKQQPDGTDKPLKMIVFSDDIQWCKENMGRGKRIEYSEGRDELGDMSLMASCGHHIIANSSFSWWGAYLGHNPNRIVISPSCKRGNWFGLESGIKKDVVDLLPPEWVQIEFR
jgi:hypothetical protein